MSEMTQDDAVAHVTDDAFLSSFVPDLAVDLVAGSPITAPTSTHVDLVLLCMDLDGFSRSCADAVAGHDRDIDSFAAAIRDLFVGTFALVHAHGGSVFSLAGDALIAVWPVAQAPNSVARAAVACAHALDNYIGAQNPSLFTTPVSASILLDLGPAELSAVGGHEDRWLPVLLGDVISNLGAHLKSAKAGRIVATRAFAETQDAGSARALDASASYFDLFDPDTSTEPLSKPDATTRQTPVALLPRRAAAVHKTSEQWLSELRSATVIFVRRELDARAGPLPLDGLQTLVREFQEHVGAQGGTLLQVLGDDKGLVFLAAWGLSSSMHEDNAGRAVRAALEFHNAARVSGQTLDFGLCSGTVFEGMIGSNIYRQFVTIGPAVNQSAGLMQIAAGRIIADAATAHAAREKFDFLERDAVALKGQAHPKPVFELLSARTHALKDRDRLVGRSSELAKAAAVFEDAAADPLKRGLWVIGSPGTGKSHFASELVQRAQQRGAKSLTSVAEVTDLSSDFQIWRRIFDALLRGESGTETDRAGLVARLKGIAGLEDRLPFLNDVTDLNFEETALSGKLTATQRRSEVIRFLAEVAGHLIGDAAGFLMLDDVQWIDTASWSLLAAILQRCPEVDLLLVSRDLDQDKLPPEAKDLLNPHHMQQMRLSGLPRSETDALLCEVLQVRAIPEQISQSVYSRTEGHPYYSRELALVLLQRGLLHVSDGLCHVRIGLNDLESVDFPDNVQSVVRSRFSQISMDAQITLKAASVLGRSFDLDSLEHVHPSALDRVSLEAHLGAARALQLVTAPAPGRYEFNHALTRDSIYGLLVAEQRRTLHRSHAETLTTSDNAGGAALLAWHWHEAGELEKALTFLVKAADQARMTQSHMETAKHLTQALALNAEIQNPRPDQEIAIWHQNLAQALFEMNQVHASIAHFQAALKLFSHGIRISQHPVAGAIREFTILKTRGLKYEPDASKRQRLLSAADCCIHLSFQYYEIQDLIHSMHYTFLAVNLAKMAGGDSEALARGNMNLSIASFSLPFALDGDKHLRYGLEIAERSVDPRLQYWVHFTASSYNAAAGRLDACITDVQRARDIAQKHMLPRDIEAADAQLAVSWRLSAEYQKSAAADQSTIDSARARGVLQTQIWSLAGHLKSYMMLGDTAMQVQSLDALRSLLSDPTARENCSASNFAVYCMGEAFAAGDGDRPEDQADWLAKGVETLASISDPQVYMTDAPGYFTDALLHAWYCSNDGRYLVLAKKLRKCAVQLARLYPGARAIKHVVIGDVARIAGNRKAAERAWTKAVTVAQDAGLPLEIARGRHRLTHGQTGASRPECLDALPHNIPYTWVLLEQNVTRSPS